MTVPNDLIEYLANMISPPEPHGRAVYVDLDDEHMSGWADESVTGLIVRGTPTAEQTDHLMRVLKPGAHLLIIAPDEEPTGHTGACRVEDAGFEIRDTILLAREEGALHYVPKASRSEREEGCAGLKGKRGHEAVERKEGTDGLKSPRAGAGRTAGRVKNYHPCLHPEALVMTETGYRPINEIKEGEMVYGADGQFHPVKCVSAHPYASEDLYEIAVQGTNYTTLASDNHPFLVWRPVRRGPNLVGGDVVWVPSEELQKGDYTMTPVLAEQNLQSEHDEDYWFVFGLWVAEGVLQRAGHGKNVYPSYTLHKDEKELIQRLQEFFGKRGANVGVYPKKGAKAVQVIGFDPKVGEQFKKWSPTGAPNKRIPYIVWWRSEKCRRALFEGYMAGDGSNVRTYRQTKTVSPDLGSQLRLLGESLGTKANLFRYAAQPGSVGRRRFKSTCPTYQVTFYERDANQTTRKPACPAFLDHDGVKYRLSYVQKVTPVPYEGDVWNLTVMESPTFQTAVGMSHNTVKPKDVFKRLLDDVPLDVPTGDNFLGSGSCALACLETGHDFVGVEREAEYLEIADARVRHWNAKFAGHGERAVVDSDVEGSGDEVEIDEKPDSDTCLMDLFWGGE